MTRATPRSDQSQSLASTAAAASCDGWHLDGHRRRSRVGDLGVTIDLERPLDGIMPDLGSGDGTSRGGDHLLGVDLRAECRIADPWQRGRDLTAVYEPSDDRHLRATTMWRISDLIPATHPAIAAWECVVSAQTSLLQSDATLAVVSRIVAGEILWGLLDADLRQPAFAAVRSANASLILARRDDGRSLLLAAHPLDPQQISCDHLAGLATIRHWLFAAAVEKGVLLRSRVLAAIGPAGDDTAWAGRLAEAFANSPPILTT